MAGLFKSGRGSARTLAPMLSHLATGMPTLDAHDDFARARRAQRVARSLPVAARRPRVPRTLPAAAALPHGAPLLKRIADIEAWVTETGSLPAPALAAAA
jgi:hypothetical protein